jgi:hypothetical protein
MTKLRCQHQLNYSHEEDVQSTFASVKEMYIEHKTHERMQRSQIPLVGQLTTRFSQKHRQKCIREGKSIVINKRLPRTRTLSSVVCLWSRKQEQPDRATAEDDRETLDRPENITEMEKTSHELDKFQVLSRRTGRIFVDMKRLQEMANQQIPSRHVTLPRKSGLGQLWTLARLNLCKQK